MNRIIHKIQAVMIGEETPGPLLDFLLTGISAIYGMVVKLRNFLYDRGLLAARTLPCRVISVGNLTVGGTGKTPMTIYLAELLQNAGFNIVVISRGYKGAAEHRGGIVSDRRTILLGPDIAGDEPFMMAHRLKGIPVLVGSDRFQTGMMAVENFSPDVILLDDAFQNRRLRRDADVVLVDDKSFFGSRHLLPRGILREPVSGLLRADLLVLTRCADNSRESPGRLAALVPGKPIFRSFHEPYICGIFNGMTGEPAADAARNGAAGIEWVYSAKVFVFSGIARNNEFLKTVEGQAGEVLGAIFFKDHHRYTDTDCRRILDQARQCSAQFLVTTEKDYVKISGKFQSPVDIVVVGIRMSFRHDAVKFSKYITKKITRTSPGYKSESEGR